MANPEHLKILQQGVEVWNQWRDANSNVIPELESANLSFANLSTANLSGANLVGAKLTAANLNCANMGSAQLTDADLSNAILIDADMRLSSLNAANLRFASLDGAQLQSANLYKANLRRTNLCNANLSKAELVEAMLIETTVRGTNFCGSIVGGTTFISVDLSGAINLEAVWHIGPSNIGIETVYKSRGEIPVQFLRGTGVPDEVIDLARSIRCGPPIQWHSCFISYSSKDEEFAKRLHARMREANMRVWFAPEDMKGGKKIHEQLFEAIQIHDKLLLVLSDNSILSEWVMTEIRKARAQEKKENCRKLFPIRLVDFDTLREWTCFDSDSGKDLAVEVREYFIPDFSNWKDHDSFEKAFDRLQKDLKAEGPLKPSSRASSV
jgi:hypothetical protein